MGQGTPGDRVSCLMKALWCLGVPWWLCGLRIQCCHRCGSGHCYSVGSIPSPGTFCRSQAWTKRKREKERELWCWSSVRRKGLRLGTGSPWVNNTDALKENQAQCDYHKVEPTMRGPEPHGSVLEPLVSCGWRESEPTTWSRTAEKSQFST